MASTLWENMCRRCGRCCYEKIEYEGEIYYTSIPCHMLDLKSRLCTIYEARTSKVPGCVELTHDIIRRGFLPHDCPYVQGVEGYRPPHLHEPEPT